MFTIKKWKIDPDKNAVSFYYTCDVYGDFSENIIFPVAIPKDDKAVSELLDVMAAYLGVSYYKLVACGHIKADVPLGVAAQKSVKSLYTQGLGEFYIRNDLAYPPSINFEFTDRKTPPNDVKNIDNQRTIVAFGGGKDSHVALSLLDKAGIEKEIVSVVLSNKVKDTLKKLAGFDIRFIERKIDPKLIALGKEGQGYNGHVPITAINSIILSAHAYMNGFSWIVFSNERGASVPTMQANGHDVNHQYSKSLEFEGFFRDTLAEITGGNLQYFSLLRPFSELWIAKQLAEEAVSAHDVFSSCNKNFIFDGEGKLQNGQRWCGKCSKCVYTAIILSPYFDHQKMISVFGCDILNDEENISVAKDLCGIGSAKPWECVGDFADTAAALMRGQENKVLTALKSDLTAQYGADFLDKRFDSEIASRSAHYLRKDLKTLI